MQSPVIYKDSKIISLIISDVLQVGKIFPNWILKLPLERLKYVLEGYKDGDGTHTGKLVGKELHFNTSNILLHRQITFILLRFGILSSTAKYYTQFKKKYGDRKFPFYRNSIWSLSTFDILSWDSGIIQTNVITMDLFTIYLYRAPKISLLVISYSVTIRMENLCG